jgi:hypothetical protein
MIIKKLKLFFYIIIEDELVDVIYTYKNILIKMKNNSIKKYFHIYLIIEMKKDYLMIL